MYRQHLRDHLVPQLDRLRLRDLRPGHVEAMLRAVDAGRPLFGGFTPRCGLDGAELMVGYVGRLAPEKRLHLLAPLTRPPGVRVVSAGDGP